MMGGCSWLPASGPSRNDVLDGYRQSLAKAGIKIVDVTPAIAHAADRAVLPLQTSVVPNTPAAPADTIAVGDTLSITIFEIGGASFSPGTDASQMSQYPAGANQLNLPDMTVGTEGNISVPYAGRIEVLGKTAPEVQEAIEKNLSAKLFQPQVIVSIKSSSYTQLTILGDVKKAGRFPVFPGERLLDGVALAEGPEHPDIDETVAVYRGEHRMSGRLDLIEHNERLNIGLQPLDRIQMTYNPQSYTVFGATGRTQEIVFDRENTTLEEALAKAGGLSDYTADVAGIFLFRFEMPNVINASPASGRADVPVIYHLNLKDPHTFFVLKQFSVHDKDLIYIADAKAVQIQKFFALIGQLFTPAEAIGVVKSTY
jgi:polysaccharide export outer membrane protein